VVGLNEVGSDLCSGFICLRIEVWAGCCEQSNESSGSKKEKSNS
jgi:hypothetical protein